MNVNLPHPWLPSHTQPTQQTIHEVKELIDGDDAEQVDELESLLEQGVITANTPSGENGECLVTYAVRQYALFSFSAMVTAHAEAVEAGFAVEDLNQTDWDGNSAWHALALHLNDNEFFETGGWPNEMNRVLGSHPLLQIDWDLRNLQDQTPLEVAQALNKSHIATWITRQMEGHAALPMDVDSD